MHIAWDATGAVLLIALVASLAPANAQKNAVLGTCPPASQPEASKDTDYVCPPYRVGRGLGMQCHQNRVREDPEGLFKKLPCEQGSQRRGEREHGTRGVRCGEMAVLQLSCCYFDRISFASFGRSMPS